ncbi:MAG: YkgJ family cysteine cluster protein [Myxococcales bacterium]|nr:YkgJ family cysteine cluster protein [Myxococcales bacterium]
MNERPTAPGADDRMDGRAPVPSAVHSAGKANPARPVEPEDVENGLRFGHLMAVQTKRRLNDVAASLHALLETLVAQGTLSLDDYERRREVTKQREVQRTQSEALVSLGDTVDKYAATGLPEINCAELRPLCKSRCCTLKFSLSIQDLDERVVRWDYSRPYQIASRPDGYCVHCDAEKGACQVYQQRPAVCRTYDCRKDSRIWLDFDKRIPAPEGRSP